MGLKLGKKLGNGSFGSVFEGVLTKRGKRPLSVAVKKIEEERHFKSEAAIFQLLKGREHVNVINFIVIFPKSHRIVMELCKGDFQSVCGKMDDGALINAFLEICAGMQFLHDIGIVHHDLKEVNILIGQDDHFKLADFGLSFKSSEECYKMNAGTLKYKAPEILAKNSCQTSKIDVYAFGMMIYNIVHTFPRIGDKVLFTEKVINGDRFPFPKESIFNEIITKWGQ